ncbi:hypothetical protein ACFYW9_36835 [Streptomyces sp. NPDC002698]|uniref:hypothetical protein n=1 Tax=Streptomyces sp. NPDC002698 TaxID=3364660 RepID=UPI0036CE3DA2
MTPRPVLNRSLLALAGLVLLGGGLLILFAGLDIYRRHDLAPPADWPLITPNDVLLGSADRARWSSQGWWWWPAVIALLALVALLALWWLLVQYRGTPTGRAPQTAPRPVSRVPPAGFEPATPASGFRSHPRTAGVRLVRGRHHRVLTVAAVRGR